MKRYLSTLFLVFITGFLAISCVNEMDLSETITDPDVVAILVPRVKGFANQYVTKSEYAAEEQKISSVSLLVFNNSGNLVFNQEQTVNNNNVPTITLKKSMLESPAQRAFLDKSTVVMMANIDLSDFKKTDGTDLAIDEHLTLTAFLSANLHLDAGKTVITSLTDAFNGFPMMGIESQVNLSAASSQSSIEVSLEILYAKVNFSIDVANGGENEGTGMQFLMSKYTINNVAKASRVALSTQNPETPSADYDYTGAAFSVDQNKTATLTSNPVTFTFYVAETRYKPAADLSGIYPGTDWVTQDNALDVKGFDANNPNHQRQLNGINYKYDSYAQHYKPQVADKDGGQPGKGLAAYVTLHGTYTDYRGKAWTVKYKIYLGKNNATNFQVDRNSEYTNHITIKGIRNSSDLANGEVWIDHRVDASVNGDDASKHVKITRETIIDSHIEVRPLRVQWEEGKYYCVRLYLPTNEDGSLINWIGVERFTGENCQGSTQYCYQNNKSIGKRRYFTQNLIEELQANEGEFGIQIDEQKRKYINLFNQECAWIYFDENTTDNDRQADIKLDFIAYDGSTTIAAYTYKVTQQGLSTVSIKNADNSESILRYESYEEYLHSYDPIDQYDLSTSPYDYTKQGLAWGLNEVPLSSEYVVSAAPLDPLDLGWVSVNFIERGWMDDITSRYDYFHKNDAPSGNSYFTYTKSEGNWERLSCGTGLDFTERASIRVNPKITVVDMATMPTSAYQYCLSKNKFAADDEGNVQMTVNWYLPDVYELQAILTKIKEEAVPGDFVTDAFYWSSQPSRNSTMLSDLPLIGQYLDNIDFAAEDNANARAVSLSKDGTVTVQNTSRTTPNRIRCLYSPTGKPTDMDGRTPEGIGGKVTFVMKALNGNQEGHFNDLLSRTTERTIADKTETTIVKGDEPYTNETFAWPTFSSDASKLKDFGFFNDKQDANGNTITGFSEDPANATSWEKLLVADQVTDSYTTLYNFPGLHINTMDKYTGQNAYKPTTTKKSKTVTEKNIRANQYSGVMSYGETRSLDNMLNITFATHASQTNHSRFEYSAYVTGSKEQVKTSYWKVPSYHKVSLDENNPINYTKTYTATYKQNINDLGDIWNIIEGLKPKALAAAKQLAKNEYPGCIYSYGEPEYEQDYGNEGKWYNPKYYAQVTCTLTITSSNFYYQDAVGGGWDDENAQTKTVEYTGVQHDELRMFSGNSFTLSLSEKFKNTHEIVSVIVYYSGDNKMKSASASITQSGYDIYARFVESSITPPSQQSTPPQLVGMDYHEEGNGTGLQRWSGDGKESITMNLMDYVVTKPYIETGLGNLGDYAYLYRDITTSGDKASNLTKHIVIDKIEVKVVKKTSSQTE